MSDVKVQFVGNSAGISHQNLFSGRMISIIQEEVPVLVPPTEPSIVANNQLAMTVSTGVIQTPQALKTTMMQEFILDTTLYNMGVNRNPWRFIRASIDGSTPDTIGSGPSTVDICPSTSPPFV